MEVKEVITQSWLSLMRNRLRSCLTMLGIVWGITSVVLLLGYGQGVGQSILSAFLGIGNNVILLWGGQTSVQVGGERAGKRVHYEYEDLQAIRDEVPLVRGVSTCQSAPVHSWMPPRALSALSAPKGLSPPASEYSWL